MNFTDEQKRVIGIKGDNVLVSAAAGSGKTAVVVERVLETVAGGTDISNLLIVTFTRAASGEMKNRIREAIEQRLLACGDDPALSSHLAKQLTLIFDAPITTIDGFCLDVIRNNFNISDIDPSFRVGDEGELKMLRGDVLEELMESCYKEEDGDFYGFLERFSVKRSDSDVTEAIGRLYDFAVSRPDPEGYLKKAAQGYAETDKNCFDDNPVIREAVFLAKRKLKECRSALDEAIAVSQKSAGPYFYEEVLRDDADITDRLILADGFSGLQEAYCGLKFKVLPSKKDDSVDPGLRQRVKDIRGRVKDEISALGDSCFSKKSEEIIEEFERLQKDTAILSELTLKFLKAFKEAKKKRNIMDFTDIEHTALDILKDPQTGEKYKRSFTEIIVDEYQDSNRLQEEIFSLISNGKDYFCVGDVKQSIYGFRDACPALFKEKYQSYGSTGSDKGTLLLLSKNFRSRRSVLEAVNGLFKNVMHESAGSVEYDAAQFLYFGDTYKKEIKEDVTEYMLALFEDKKNADPDETEALAVAGRIKELVGNYDIEDKKTHEIRKCSYGDIVILMRALKGRDEKFMEILMKKGIPVCIDASDGYLLSDEIKQLVNFLTVIDNPRQDIPLAGTCLGVFGGFDESELSLIRGASRDTDLYTAVVNSAKDGTAGEKLQKKTRAFLDRLSRYRRMASFLPINELISLIVAEYGYDDHIRAQNGGKIRIKNLDMFLYRASQFEKTSFMGLFRFIRYIEYVKKYEINIDQKNPDTAAGDAVRIMSIHHSKGLEFPVVFLCGMQRTFNMSDMKERILTDDELGIGMDLIDIDKRTRSQTVIKKVISQKKKEAALAEELRILYVAMTRAEQKLIMTGAVLKEEKDDRSAPYIKVPAMPCAADSFAGFLEYALLCDPGVGESIKKTVVTPDDLQYMDEEEKKDTALMYEDFLSKADSVPDTVVDEIRSYMKRSYPFQISSVPGKLSVSQLKHEAMEEKGVELLGAIEEKTDLVPAFISGRQGKPGGPVRGAVRGSAYHTVFENIDLNEVSDEEGAERLIGTLVEKGKLDEAESGMVDKADIAAFVNSPLGIRMKKAQGSGKLFREQPFVILLEASKISEEYPPGEKVMVQGVIDAFFEEDGKIVIVDYKTDNVSDPSELVKRYREQLYYYEKALIQLTGMAVGEKILYSVTLGMEIVVE